MSLSSKQIKEIIDINQKHIDTLISQTSDLQHTYDKITKTGKYDPENACPLCKEPLWFPVGGGRECSSYLCSYVFCH